MIGIELCYPCNNIVNIALKNKLLINVTSEKVVRLLPPLIINEKETKVLCDRLTNAIETFLKSYE